jgi:hypothetical protein
VKGSGKKGARGQKVTPPPFTSTVKLTGPGKDRLPPPTAPHPASLLRIASDYPPPV